MKVSDIRSLSEAWEWDQFERGGETIAILICCAAAITILARNCFPDSLQSNLLVPLRRKRSHLDASRILVVSSVTPGYATSGVKAVADKVIEKDGQDDYSLNL